MTESFITPSYIFDFETANEMVALHQDQSTGNQSGQMPQDQNFLKTEQQQQHSPIFQQHQQHQHQHQHQHHHQGDESHQKHFESYYTELGNRDMSVTDLELQNNNGSFGWSHPGMVCPPPDLNCMVDSLDASLSDQSGLNMSFESEDKFGQSNMPPKKGRGGRKKSARSV